MDNERRTILRLEHITRSFPALGALDDVNFELYENEILGLCGENGAGKSTLLKVFSGIYKAEEGRIFYNGEERYFKTPAESIRAGISIIHQELSYINDLSVAENVFQGRLPLRHGFVDWKKLNKDAQELLDAYDIPVSAKSTMRHLPMAQKQLVEIIKAVSVNARILVMDEPTSSLGLDDVQKLMSSSAASQNGAFPSSLFPIALKSLFEICNRIVVLRDGKTVGEFKSGEYDHLAVVSKMVGRTVTQLYPKEKIEWGDVAFEVRGLTSKVLRDINIQVRSGQIVGLYGMAGAGQDEIMDTVFGLEKEYRGEVYVDGKQLNIHSPKDAINNKIAYVTAERKRNGLILIHSVHENIALASLDDLVQGHFVRYSAQREMGKRWVDELGIKTSSGNTPVGSLSGGNQQKVVMAKWFERTPRILLLNEPTRGVVVGAKQEIFRIVQDMCKQGMAVLMISSDMLEMLSMADVIHTVWNGQITRLFNQEDATQVKLMMASINKFEEEEHGDAR